MIRATLASLLLCLSASGGWAQTPTEIAAEAPAADWAEFPAENLLVMDLVPDQHGKPRRIVIALMPPPFAVGHVANIRLLAHEHWWDGTSINRVQDNYVVQWGDATEKKPLPAGLIKVPESDYVTPAAGIGKTGNPGEKVAIARTVRPKAPQGWHQRDSYADRVDFYRGWPLAGEGGAVWPVHCYGMVGVGRDVTPDTGTGAELYVVIGQAPRQLDRNIALVGRVVEGIEHLSSLPRGTGALGFYETAEERTPIASVRLAADLPETARPRFEYLSTESMSFARYVAARASRKDSFYFRPAGGIDVCNSMPPVRPVKPI